MEKFTKEFKGNGDAFSAVHKATEYLRENDYSYGSMCGNEPIAVMKGVWNIAKWKNLIPADRDCIDGKLTSDDFRNGNVLLVLNI